MISGGSLMSTLGELQELKKKLENLSRERAKVQGMREQLLSQLRDMGIASYEAGRVREAELKVEQAEAERKARALLDELKETYKEFL
jgi:uncharacterized protein YqfA (UPF0365 family)